jgi:hypothetical protein
MPLRARSRGAARRSRLPCARASRSGPCRDVRRCCSTRLDSSPPPFAAATISQLPSLPGNQPSGVVRSAPLLRPMVVRTRAFKPIILPLRRIRSMARFVHHLTIGPPVPGCQPPRVPAGVSKLMGPPECSRRRASGAASRPTSRPSSPRLLLVPRSVLADQCRSIRSSSRRDTARHHYRS